MEGNHADIILQKTCLSADLLLLQIMDLSCFVSCFIGRSNYGFVLVAVTVSLMNFEWLSAFALLCKTSA